MALEHLTKQISTLKEKCINNEEHQLEPFIYYGKKSDFEEICVKCGGFDINPEGIYSHIGLIHYIDSKRYQALVYHSEHIQKQNKVID